MTRRKRNLLIGAVLTVGMLAGLFLVVTGDDGGSSTTSTTTSTDRTEPTGSGEPLALPAELTQAAVAELSGLAMATSATDFLTARLDGDRQLDITFVLPADAVDGFITQSGLDEPEQERRVVLHSSPLWKLNPEPGTELAGTVDTEGQVKRAVELLSQPDGTVRVRAVLTSA